MPGRECMREEPVCTSPGLIGYLKEVLPAVGQSAYALLRADRRPSAAQHVLLDLARRGLGQLVDEVTTWAL